MEGDITVNKSVIFTATEYGGVLLNDRTGQYWRLNRTSAGLFADLQAGISLEDIAARLVERYDGVTNETALADLDEVIRKFRLAGLIR